MAAITWSEKSISDLEEIYDYIALESPFYAQYQVEKIIASVERLLIFPTSGRSLPEFPASPIREIIVDPYRIIYRCSDPDVFVVAVIHGKRLLREDML